MEGNTNTHERPMDRGKFLKLMGAGVAGLAFGGYACKPVEINKKEVRITIDDFIDRTGSIFGDDYFTIIGSDSAGIRYRYGTEDYALKLSRLKKEGRLNVGDTLILRGEIKDSDLEKAAKNKDYMVPVTYAGIRRPDGSNPLKDRL